MNEPVYKSFVLYTGGEDAEVDAIGVLRQLMRGLDYEARLRVLWHAHQWAKEGAAKQKPASGEGCGHG